MAKYNEFGEKAERPEYFILFEKFILNYFKNNNDKLKII